MKGRWCVGHTDSTPLTKEESNIGKAIKQRCFDTLGEAYTFFDTLKGKFMDKVVNGDYYLDSPNDPPRE